MYRKRIYILLLLFSNVASYEVEVNVKQGVVVGITEATVLEGRRYYAFYGVPYARPPIRKFRFKDPVVSPKWKYAYDARTVYRGSCAQPQIVHKHALYGTEDCLYLNIYTPSLLKSNNNHLKPVIVFIHGYSFTSSFSHLYGADFLIENDVLLVTVTHRLGAFGFAKVNTTDSHANMGLKDIVKALKWIRTNINKFAGDKSKVTVAGSGSAASFLSLLLMTKSRKLFSKMILQSGSLLSPAFFQHSETLEFEKLNQELQKRGIIKLSKASTEDIVLASQKIYNAVEVTNYQRNLVPFLPITEAKSNGSLLTTRPENFQSRMSIASVNLPLLVGFTSRESISEVIPFIHNPYYLTMFTHVFKFMVPFSDGCRYDYTTKVYEEIAIKLKNEYFPEGLTEKALDDFLRYTTDLYKYPIYKFVKVLLGLNFNKIFMYKFNYVGKFNSVKQNSLTGANVAVKGAASGDELCYLFKCEPMWESYLQFKNETSSSDIVMIKQMAKWWSDFAKTGEPVPAPQHDNNIWPAMSSNDNRLMLIGRKSKLVHSTAEEKCYKFWNNIYDDYYRNEACERIRHDEL